MPYATDTILQDFRPFPLLRNPHLQTLLAAKCTLGREPPAVTQYVPLADADTIALEVSTPQAWQSAQPTVVLLHGLCGCHRSPYMQRLTWQLLRRGIRAVRMNLRGCGSGKGMARHPYHSGRSADVHAVLDAVHRATPQSPITLLGFSLSGNIVLKLAGEYGATPHAALRHVIAVCPPVALEASARRLLQPRNWLYNRYFTRLLCADVADRQRSFPELPTVSLATVRSVCEFDEVYTAPQGGFRNAREYYHQSSAAPLLPRITVPCHILCAADDPLVDSTVLAHMSLPDHVHVMITTYGGHVGFLGRPGRPGGYRAMDAQLLAWMLALMPEYGCAGLPPVG